jgi:hypothetical protein
MPLLRSLDEYLAGVKKRAEERKKREEQQMSFGRHGGRGQGQGCYTGRSYHMEYGVYLVEGVYYISTWTDLPFSHVGAIEKFYAKDKRDAIIKGATIVETHAEQNAALPEAERVVTVLKEDDVGNNEFGGYP